MHLAAGLGQRDKVPGARPTWTFRSREPLPWEGWAVLSPRALMGWTGLSFLEQKHRRSQTTA
jgi:hypothetical protein